MRQDVVESPPELAGAKGVVTEERRLLDIQHVPTQLSVESGLEQPRIWLQAVIVTRVEKREKKSSRAQRPASIVEQGVMVAQPKGNEQAELRGTEQVVIDGRPHIGHVVVGNRAMGCFQLAELRHAIHSHRLP